MATSLEKVPLLCSQRFMIVIMAFWGMFFLYLERVNLSVAILCMVKSDVKSSNTSSYGLDAQNSTSLETGNERGEVDWDKSMQSQLLAMYYYGYVFTSFLGGWLSSRFGCRRVWGASQLISSICALLTPISARIHFYMTCAVRFVLGFSAGMAYPVVYALLGRWTPPLERSQLVTYTLVGTIVGLVVTLAVSGLLCEYGFDSGWGSIFYLSGISNLLWVAAWFLFASDGPENHKWITDKEKDYIRKAIGKGTGSTPKKTPWIEIFKSKAVWANTIAHIATVYTLNTQLTFFPMYLKEALDFDIKQNGVLSSLSYVTYSVAGVMFGYVADKVIERGWLNVKNTRKFFQTVSLGGSAVLFCIAVQLNADQRYVIVAAMCIATALQSACGAGFLSNQIDIAPSYSGIVCGVTNTFANVFGLTAPAIAGALTPNKTATEWRNVFYLMAGISMAGCIAFLLMAEGDLQEWAVVEDQQDADDHNTQRGKRGRENGSETKIETRDEETALL